MAADPPQNSGQEAGGGSGVRLFAALPLSTEVKNALLESITGLKKQGQGNFSRPENLHLTLAFVGETERIDAAVEALSKLDAACFELCLSGSGCFDHLLWAGIAHNPALESLAAQTQMLLREAGFVLEEREFIPHITLVRNYTPFDGETPQFAPAEICMTVTHLSLMRSEQIGGKLTYTEVFGKELT